MLGNKYNFGAGQRELIKRKGRHKDIINIFNKVAQSPDANNPLNCIIHSLR